MIKSLAFATVRGRRAVILAGSVLTALAVLCLVALVSAEAPAVSVAKSVQPTETDPGLPIVYTVVFTNNTGTDQYIDVISDTLPANFALASMAAGSDIQDLPDDGTTGTIVWSEHGPYTVSVGSSLSLIYNVWANAPALGPYDNHVEARLDDETVVEASATVKLVAVDLDGTKTASVDQVRVGDPLEYTVSLTNNGNLTATLSSIVDTLPAGFEFEEMVTGPLPDPTTAGNKLTWGGPIDITPTATLEFSYRVTAGGTPGDTPHNSVVATYNGETAGPFEDGVLLLPRIFYAYLPLTMRSLGPGFHYRLAYDHHTGENIEIVAIDANGDNRVNVSNEAGGDVDPDWSPDGSKLTWVHFYDGKGDIMVSNADGTGKVNLTNHPKEDRSPTWSRDGSKILFRSLREEDKWHLYIMDPDGSDVERLTFQACQSHSGVWSPDGTRIAYVCGINEYADIYVMDADGQNVVRLTHNEVPDEVPAWSPDGARLVYVRYTAANKQKSDIWVVDVATETNTQLTTTEYADYSPDWSPDGGRIAFSTYLDGTYEIALMDPDGSKIVNLTQAEKGDFVPRWSPDGTKIAFVSTRGGERALYVMNADGSEQMRLDSVPEPTEDYVSIPNWKPQ